MNRAWACTRATRGGLIASCSNSVTFGPCAVDPTTGYDVCNEGDLYPLEVVSNATLEGCDAVAVSVTEVVKGLGPDLCPLRDGGYCVDDVTDLSGGAPFTYEVAQLDVVAGPFHCAALEDQVRRRGDLPNDSGGFG